MQSKAEAADKKDPVVIKKYANRRLYNTETSTYVTLEDLAAMVRSERDFVVYDAKSGDDLTHSVLTQIIVEQESRAGTQTLLPVPFLRQLIRFYGDAMEKMVPSYLQVSLDMLTRDQDKFRKQFTNAFTPQGAFEAYHEQARKNLAMFEQAMSMFTPFAKGGMPGMPGMPGMKKPDETQPGRPEPGRPEPSRAAEAAKPAPQQAAASGQAATNELAEMKALLANMQQQIKKLSESGGKG